MLHKIYQMLYSVTKKLHIVRKGQSLANIAEFYCVSAHLLAKENDLKEEVYAGQVLKIPNEKGNAYFVQEGDSKALLCGSEENYEKKNGTDIFYIGMRVIL